MTGRFRFSVGHIPDKERPAFHITPTIGWMNDPNGFSVYKGEYHLFYQYHPYSCEWGPMHWGHVKTKDFIRWERLPAALAPDQEKYDTNGCFSGGAVIGAIFMGVLNNGMSILGIDSNWQRAVKGLVLLAAVVFDVLSKKRSTKA